MPVIPALRRLGQEDWEFEVSLGYIARLSNNKKNNINSTFVKINEP
jgi:hypothetical protein